LLSENESDDYWEMPGYQSKTPFVKNIFHSRLETAMKFGSINDDSRILDIGCYKGILIKMIRKRNKLCECYGIDNNPAFFSNLKIEKCSLKVADVINMPFPDGFFDAIFALDVLEHVEDLNKAIDEINRVLKPNGFFILSGPTETLFYKFCRFLWLKKAITQDDVGHIYSVYDIEKKFEKNNFKLIELKRFPNRPLPELFRITKFKKNMK